MAEDRVSVITPRGRPGNPTKYTEDMPQLLIDFFDRDVDDYLIHTYTAGKKSNIRVKPQCIPSILKFCRQYDIGKTTFYNWVAAHPEFREAAEMAKAMHEDIIVNIGIATNGQFSNFMLRCNFAWDDRSANKLPTTPSTGRPVKIVMKRMSDARKEEIREEQAKAAEEYASEDENDQWEDE